MRLQRILSEINSHFETSEEDYKLLDTDVVNNQYRILVKCGNKKHDQYWVSWQHYKNRGDKCGKCRYINNGKKSLIYTEEKIDEIVNELGYVVMGINTIGDEAEIIISSSEGYVVNSQINNLKRGKPQFFHKKNSHTINNIKLWCKLNEKSFTLVSDEYIKSGKDLTWKCLKCDENFERSWNTTNKNIFECPYCSGTKASEKNNLLLTNPDLSKQWDYVKNHPLRPEQVLPNTTKKFWWVCDLCGHEWQKSVHYRNQRNSPCPSCKTSKGEYAVKSYLDDNNIKYYQEYKFNDCKNIKKLRFDFYLPEHNICIEYQGEFHYNIIEGISKADSLDKQKKCDDIKRNYCVTNNIKLLEIPYWDFNKIENILINCNLFSLRFV